MSKPIDTIKKLRHSKTFYELLPDLYSENRHQYYRYDQYTDEWVKHLESCGWTLNEWLHERQKVGSRHRKQMELERLVDYPGRHKSVEEIRETLKGRKKK